MPGFLTAKFLTRMESGFDRACSLALHITSMPALDSTSHTSAGYVSVGTMAVCKSGSLPQLLRDQFLSGRSTRRLLQLHRHIE